MMREVVSWRLSVCVCDDTHAAGRQRQAVFVLLLCVQHAQGHRQLPSAVCYDGKGQRAASRLLPVVRQNVLVWYDETQLSRGPRDRPFSGSHRMRDRHEAHVMIILCFMGCDTLDTLPLLKSRNINEEVDSAETFHSVSVTIETFHRLQAAPFTIRSSED